jgi:hypothetical protein
MDKHPQASTAERKAYLLEEAARHRDAIVLARRHIRSGARPEVLVHNAVDYATYAVRSRVDSLLSPAGLSMTAVAPYALQLLRMLRRRGQLKPALGVAGVLAGAFWYYRHRRAAHAGSARH